MMLVAAMLAVSTPVVAQETATQEAMITANVDVIAKLLTDEGYRAKVEFGSDGDPYIRSASGGRNFTIYFLGCKTGVKLGPCDSIEFYTGFTTGKPFAIERTNAWNAKNRYGRSYVDSDADPVVEMDLLFDIGGISQKLFVENLHLWTDVMANFDAFVFDDGDDKKEK